MDHVDAVRDRIKKYPNRAVDNCMIDITRQTPSVRTAHVIGPIIYGKGRGPIKQRSTQIPELCRIAIERKRAVQIGKGLSRWGNVHVEDLSDLFVRLIREALNGSTDDQLWGADGVYFSGSGPEMVSQQQTLRSNMWQDVLIIA